MQWVCWIAWIIAYPLVCLLVVGSLMAASIADAFEPREEDVEVDHARG